MVLMAGFHTTFAQPKVERFKTIDGKTFSRLQRDSIENAGNFVGVKEQWQSHDTAWTSIFFYDKKFLLTPLQKKLIGKPLSRISLMSLDGDSIRSADLIGKPALFFIWALESLKDEERNQLNDLKERFGDQVSFIGVPDSTEQGVRNFLAHVSFNYHLAINAGSWLEKMNILNHFQLFILVDSAGNVHDVAEGVPVDLRTKPDGTHRVSETEPFRLLLSEYFGSRLEALLK